MKITTPQIILPTKSDFAPVWNATEHHNEVAGIAAEKFGELKKTMSHEEALGHPDFIPLGKAMTAAWKAKEAAIEDMKAKFPGISTYLVLSREDGPERLYRLLRYYVSDAFCDANHEASNSVRNRLARCGPAYTSLAGKIIHSHRASIYRIERVTPAGRKLNVVCLLTGDRSTVNSGDLGSYKEIPESLAKDMIRLEKAYRKFLESFGLLSYDMPEGWTADSANRNCELQEANP